MITGELSQRAERLRTERVPFVVATVVRARRPTSVRPGDAALITGEGTIDGFVGGVCAESTVRLYALRALETGEPVLLRLVPGPPEGSGDDAVEGAVVEHNPCLSGGALEILIEPVLPALRIAVVGHSPIADALRRVAAAAGYVTGSDSIAGDVALVVSSHGSDEEDALVGALRAGVPYVALVASRRRGEAVRASLQLPDELRAQLHTPAGLDIGARTPADIAISILAQLVAERHTPPPAVVATAVDPVCGMTVAITADTPTAAGEYFCCAGCRDAYAAQQT